MTKTSRTSHLLSGLLGGIAAVLMGALLIAFDVIDTGDEKSSSQEGQAPLVQPVEEGEPASSDDGEGLSVNQIYDRDGPGVAFIQAKGVSEDSPFGESEGGTATGSGFTLDKDGYLLTNAHVVDGASDVKVRFGEEELIDAEVVGADVSTDLALLKVDPKDTELKPLALGDSKQVEVGDPAVAIGNPFGFDRTVTTGIVSALQRQIQAPNGFAIDNVLQTDASINPGNSGGPLLDAQGRVIGVNSQIATGGTNGSVGIGFTVPINTAKEVIPQLKSDGAVKRAFIGATTSELTEQIADDFNLSVKEGALVVAVVKDGPADKAGLRAGETETAEGLVAGGDIIVGVDGRAVKKPEDVSAAIEGKKVGDEVEIEFLRDEDRETVTLKLGERPDEAQAQPEGPGAPPVP